MQNEMRIFATLFLTVLYFQSFAQTKPFSKLELKPGETFNVDASNILIVDTLILHNKSTIRFGPYSKGMLGVRVAYVGKDCTITSKGIDGQHGKLNYAGTNGEDGSNLEIDIHFMKLGSLTIDTRGGNGGNGYIGRHGGMPRESKADVPLMHTGSNGQPGTPGGIGGNGGDITLTYSTDGFILNFNHKPRPNQKKEVHFVEVLYEAGRDGEEGRDGNSYVGSKDIGTAVIHGRPIPTKHLPRQNGAINLINANKPKLIEAKKQKQP